MALRTNEMFWGGVMIAWGQRGYGPSVRGCNDGFGCKDGCGGGEVMVTLGTAGTEREGGFMALGAARIQLGMCESGFRDRGYRVGRCDGDFGYSGDTVGAYDGGFGDREGRAGRCNGGFGNRDDTVGGV